jgi:phage tail sheath protein FI
VAVFGATSCDDDNPVDPSNQPVVFTSQLSASNEVPPVSNSESSARGTAIVTFNVTRDASGAITDGTVTWEVSLNSFPAGARANLMHIHGPNGPVGVNQPVFINSGLTAATGVDVSSGGTATINLQAVTGPTVTPANLQAVIDNPQNFYVNVHTTANPGGAVRGQCTRQ